jgi:hypothetical protein
MSPPASMPVQLQHTHIYSPAFNRLYSFLFFTSSSRVLPIAATKGVDELLRQLALAPHLLPTALPKTSLASISLARAIPATAQMLSPHSLPDSLPPLLTHSPTRLMLR